MDLTPNDSHYSLVNPLFQHSMFNNLVVVLGATGTQGSSVINALLRNDAYVIRAVTRQSNTPAAKALTDKGIEVVHGTPTDKESLIKAFEHAYAVFGVTVPYTQDNEEVQGRNIVDAAKAAKVSLLVWSSLPSATETSHGSYTNIYHFDQKNAVDKYIAMAGQPAVILHTGSFAENLLNFHQLKPDLADPNKWNAVYPVLRPETKVAGVWIGGDLGNIVVAAIDHWEDKSWRERLTQRPIVAAPYEISGEEMVDILARGAQSVCESLSS
ncbi:NAD(P)-binding protein [Calocera viscosa TUFC12733]|uniref:NAD(P)-binding protein n=1 Tax=Calocera viscosa (strain TUFC12733) TaxID=1330018 RepID=A0A167KKX7_CALVF|nr:NAD(P)-binding protein [Calocera viscosa TUFC12733]